jgi:heat shock protein HslJ
MCLSLFASACSSTLYVSSRRADCTGAGPMKCLLIRKNTGENWLMHYGEIAGLRYREGFEYHLQVKRVHHRNPPADAPSFHYELVRVKSVTQKAGNAFLLGSGEWVLATLQDASGNLTPAADHAPVLSFNHDEGKLTGSAGCNRIFGTYTASEQQITLPALGATRMHCGEEQRMELEHRLLAILQGTLNYRLDGDRLILEGQGGIRLEYTLI